MPAPHCCHRWTLAQSTGGDIKTQRCLSIEPVPSGPKTFRVLTIIAVTGFKPRSCRPARPFFSAFAFIYCQCRAFRRSHDVGGPDFAFCRPTSSGQPVYRYASVQYLTAVYIILYNFEQWSCPPIRYYYYYMLLSLLLIRYNNIVELDR